MGCATRGESTMCKRVLNLSHVAAGPMDVKFAHLQTALYRHIQVN